MGGCVTDTITESMAVASGVASSVAVTRTPAELLFVVIVRVRLFAVLPVSVIHCQTQGLVVTHCVAYSHLYE